MLQLGLAVGGIWCARDQMFVVSLPAGGVFARQTCVRVCVCVHFFSFFRLMSASATIRLTCKCNASIFQMTLKKNLKSEKGLCTGELEFAESLLFSKFNTSHRVFIRPV